MPPDPEHDEYEQLLKVSTYFAAKFAAQFKIEPRKPLPGVALGRCWISQGVSRVYLGVDDIRALLMRHATGDWGANGKHADLTITPDQRWAPPLFSVAVQNACAVESGTGLVQSAFPHKFEQQRGVEVVKVITLIGTATYVYIPTRDAMS
jgi:hypothetical protein